MTVLVLAMVVNHFLKSIIANIKCFKISFAKFALTSHDHAQPKLCHCCKSSVCNWLIMNVMTLSIFLSQLNAQIALVFMKRGNV